MSLNDKELSSLIRAHATRHNAPEALRAGIRTQVALADAGRSGPPTAVDTRRRPWLAFGWRAASIGFALGVAFAVAVLPVVQRMEVSGPLDVELVADHVRALHVGPLAEVASTDRHTVKPWFQGRLDYAPPVFDFAGDGFPLIGGRIESVRGGPVATLAYTRRLHVIEVFVWPSEERTAPVRTVRKGFNVLHWADGSMQYWAVSDLEKGEMEHFTQLWLGQAAKR